MFVKVAAFQYKVPEETEKSIVRLTEMVGQAAWAGAKLVVAPETAIGMLTDVKNAEKDYLPDLKSIAKTHQVFLTTSFYTKVEKKYFNQGYILDPKGEVVVRHRKIYLAPPEKEADGITPGNELETSKSEIGTLGMLLCKDGFNKYSHFLYEKLSENNVDII